MVNESGEVRRNLFGLETTFNGTGPRVILRKGLSNASKK